MHLWVDRGKARYSDVLCKQVTIATAGQVLVPDIGLGIELS